jgi:hypothetical protein
MTKQALKLAGWTASLLALVATASADVKLNDTFTVSGYAAGSYEYQHQKDVGSKDSLFDASKDTPSADAVKTILTGTFKQVSAVISLYYAPNGASTATPPATGTKNSELTVLDAYVAYDAGSGFTVTAGKFCSWLGYEAFDTASMNQITYGLVTVGTLSAIPAYHTGAKVEFSDKDWGAGLAAVDSIYNPVGSYQRGDGELMHNQGYEGYLTYKGVTDLTLWGGFAYDTKGGAEAPTNKVVVFDFWAQYQLTKAAQVAAEFCNKDGGPDSKGNTWLAYFNYTFTDKISSTFRVSGEDLSGSTKAFTGNSDAVQYTICPAYKFTDNLSVRAEYSYYDYSGTSKDTSFVGTQVVFKF